MDYCTQCGSFIPDGANFCSTCGSRTKKNDSFQSGRSDNTSKKRESYDGQVHKCPNCGSSLSSFNTFCSVCGYELRDARASEQIQTFAERVANAKSNQEKITIIKSFPIPNTREDIIEFFLLAVSNFDPIYYAKHLNSEDISDAWLVKIDYCYEKARLLFPNTPDFRRICESYERIKRNIETAKKNEGIVKPDEEKRGFSSWSGGAKFFWVILNIYLCGIPALIYWLTTKGK